MTRTSTYSALLVCFLVTGCRTQPDKPSGSTSTDGPPRVAAVNYPLAYFAERIGGDLVRVNLPVPPDKDPDHWRPTPDELVRVQQADLILLNGSGYAAWTARASLPWSRCLDTSASFKDRYVKLPEAVVHKHGPEGEHSHEGLATHTWLDPQLAREHAKAILTALSRLLPDQRQALEERWAILDEELGQHATQLQALSQSRPMYGSHPVYDYLGRYCGWQLKSMHWEPEDTLSEAQWAEFAELHKVHQARFMLWEEAPADATRERLENEFQVRCIPYHICAQQPETGNYLSVMQANIARLEQALSESASSP